VRAETLAELQRHLALQFSLAPPQRVQGSPELTDVRYSYDTDARLANDVARLVVQRVGVVAKARKVSGVRRGVVELWLARRL
jgi:hypothetical protein